MNFHIPINEAAEGESQTMHIVRTYSDCPRKNKRILRIYFRAQGVPVQDIKRVMKLMGFWTAKELGHARK